MKEALKFMSYANRLPYASVLQCESYQNKDVAILVLEIIYDPWKLSLIWDHKIYNP